MLNGRNHAGLRRLGFPPAPLGCTARAKLDAVRRGWFGRRGKARNRLGREQNKLMERANKLISTGFGPWSVPGSNRRPSACKADALPTELTPRRGKSRGLIAGLRRVLSELGGGEIPPLGDQRRGELLLPAERSRCGSPPVPSGRAALAHVLPVPRPALRSSAVATRPKRQGGMVRGRREASHWIRRRKVPDLPGRGLGKRVVWQGNLCGEQVIGTIAGAARMAAAGGGDVVRLTSPPDDWLDAWDPAVHPHHAADAARVVGGLFPRRGPRPRQHPGRGPGAARGEPLRRHADRGHVRVLAGVLRPLRAAAPLPPARPRPGLPAAGGAREPVALRHRAGVAREHGRARSSATRRCSSIRAATTRRTGRAGSPANIDFAGRTGFVQLAIEHDVPIVPVVAIGGQETALFLGRGRRHLAKLLRLDSLLRLKVLPAQIGAAVRRDRARPSGPHPAARQDHGAGAAEDRPEEAARRQAGHRGGLRAASRARCRSALERARRRAQPAR